MSTRGRIQLTASITIALLAGALLAQTPGRPEPRLVRFDPFNPAPWLRASGAGSAASAPSAEGDLGWRLRDSVRPPVRSPVRA